MLDSAKPQLGRREWHRLPIEMPALLKSGKATLRGKILNISVGGALFESDRQRVRFPGPCVLRLPIEAGSTDHTFIQAQVVRTSDGRFGLRWTQRIPAHALIKLALPLER
jgi:hypothetical protein